MSLAIITSDDIRSFSSRNDASIYTASIYYLTMQLNQTKQSISSTLLQHHKILTYFFLICVTLPLFAFDKCIIYIDQRIKTDTEKNIIGMLKFQIFINMKFMHILLRHFLTQLLIFPLFSFSFSFFFFQKNFFRGVCLFPPSFPPTSPPPPWNKSDGRHL